MENHDTKLQLDWLSKVSETVFQPSPELREAILRARGASARVSGLLVAKADTLLKSAQSHLEALDHISKSLKLAKLPPGPWSYLGIHRTHDTSRTTPRLPALTKGAESLVS